MLPRGVTAHLGRATLLVVPVVTAVSVLTAISGQTVIGVG